MNTELLKEKMMIFFEIINPDELIEKYEKMGYVFIGSNPSKPPIISFKK